MYKLFGFLKNIAHFLKILVVFSILMLILFWIQNLVHTNWEWMNFYKPFLSDIVEMGGLITSGSLDLWGSIFEYKYIVAVLILVGFYYFAHLSFISLELLQEGYNKGKEIVKKIEEQSLNSMLQNQTIAEQKAIQTYQIYVNAFVKKKFSHKELNINLEEQLKIMNDFITKRTGVKPDSFEGGFLYTFNPFDNIDSILEVFFKLLKGKAPLDYVICVNVIDSKNNKEDLRKLIKLNIENKISMLANTAYRYKFNKVHYYGTSQSGLFQKENSTFEVHEFIEI